MWILYITNMAMKEFHHVDIIHHKHGNARVPSCGYYTSQTWQCKSSIMWILYITNMAMQEFHHVDIIHHKHGNARVPSCGYIFLKQIFQVKDLFSFVL